MVDLFATHEVTNQPPPIPGHDAYSADRVLAEAVEREGGAWGHDHLGHVGRRAGSTEVRAWGAQADEHPPVLHTHDRFGHRIDEVAYHPAYHSLMGEAIALGVHARPWADERPGAHVVRAAAFLLWYQAEAGHCCPMSMTYSVVPALRHQPDLARAWEPLVTSEVYDPGLRPAADKAGIVCGMAMTEKQGGSDVRANTSRAEPVDGGGPGGEYHLTGHKWFCSAPMSDAFLMLAYAPRGLSCFLVPRVLPDGTRNPLRIQRLKDKLGDRANGSSEIEFAGLHAWLVGEEGRGVATIIEMVNHTRLDCVLGSAAIMRQGTLAAIHHGRHRAAFGRTLVDQPLMANVLADLAVESEAATTAALRLARAHDPGLVDEHDVALRRVLTPIVKYFTCKRAPIHAIEAMECLGGAGYVEESGLPRLVRQSPLNGIWEGSANVICLDVLRAARRNPESVDALAAELDLARGADARLDRAIVAAVDDLAAAPDAGDLEWRARGVVERLAVAIQAALLVRHAPAAVSDAFCASRLPDGPGALGRLPAGTDAATIIDRHALVV